MDIKDLPDFFALERLSRSLWSKGEAQGTALFVGSGFSRLAEIPSPLGPKPPLWPTLKSAMEARIYKDAILESIPADPLRIAEEYRALLGQAALDDFIREQVPDHMWKPGTLHNRFLRLPWSDVLTTNWDRLLEHQANSIPEAGYELVTTAEAIARTKAPRIVKLHGSVPSGPFIFAEEDYRTYPIRHAPFVNLARQIFLENELCLVGFSGTDPNFLQWSGWVRDHLGANGRRIYLVGVLGLHAAARRLLESRNVAPIDLAPLVGTLDLDRQHQVALSLFVDYLEGAKPPQAHEWTLAATEPKPRTADDLERQRRDKKYSADLLDAAATRWEQQRRCYPGWLICPSKKRFDLYFDTEFSPLPSEEILEHIPPKRRARILYELTWRFDIGFWQMPSDLIALLDNLAIHDANSGLSRDEHLYIATVLLRTAREKQDDRRFDELMGLIEQTLDAHTDFQAAAAYEHCIKLRDRLDFTNLAKNISSVSGQDPVWSLRRASLHCDLGDYDEAARIISDAFTDLRGRQQRDRNSIWILSRCAWAQYVNWAATRGMGIVPDDQENWPSAFSAADTDPWDEIKRIQDDIDKARRENNEQNSDLRAHFDAGIYVEPGSSVRFRSWGAPSPTYLLERLTNSAGIPLLLGSVDLIRGPSRDAAALEFERSDAWYLKYLRTLGSNSEGEIEQFFDRVEIAQLDEIKIVSLVTTLKNAITFWRVSKTTRTRFHNRAIVELDLCIEILSRLAIRLPPDDARQLYDFALEMMRDPNFKHWQLWKSIDHLLQRCGEALPPDQRLELIKPALQFPLLSEYGSSPLERDWPSPLSHLDCRNYQKPKNDLQWSRRIQQLIDSVREGRQSTRSDAARRLFYLYEAGLLEPTESSSFGTALWTRCDSNTKLPSETDLPAHIFLFVPSPDADATESYFKEFVYRASESALFAPSTLIAIRGAAMLPKGSALFPERKDAVRILGSALSWRPPKPVMFDLDKNKTRQIARELGSMLTNAIMPVLVSVDLTNEKVEELFQSIQRRYMPSAIAALPWLAHYRPDYQTQTVKIIRRAIVARDFDTLAGALRAVMTWIKAEKAPHFPALPTTIVDQVVAGMASRRIDNLISLISCSRRLLSARKLTPDHCLSIVEVLGDLLDETKYEMAGPPERRPLALSMLRAECVRLAHALEQGGTEDVALTSWKDVMRSDPLPEVRWAIAETEKENGPG